MLFLQAFRWGEKGIRELLIVSTCFVPSILHAVSPGSLMSNVRGYYYPISEIRKLRLRSPVFAFGPQTLDQNGS